MHGKFERRYAQANLSQVVHSSLLWRFVDDGDFLSLGE